MEMSSSLCLESVFSLILFLAQLRHWAIALHTTGRPATQPLTHAITEDRQT